MGFPYNHMLNRLSKGAARKAPKKINRISVQTAGEDEEKNKNKCMGNIGTDCRRVICSGMRQ